MIRDKRHHPVGIRLNILADHKRIIFIEIISGFLYKESIRNIAGIDQRQLISAYVPDIVQQDHPPVAVAECRLVQIRQIYDTPLAIAAKDPLDLGGLVWLNSLHLLCLCHVLRRFFCVSVKY